MRRKNERSAPDDGRRETGTFRSRRDEGHRGRERDRRARRTRYTQTHNCMYVGARCVSVRERSERVSGDPRERGVERDGDRTRKSEEWERGKEAGRGKEDGGENPRH